MGTVAGKYVIYKFCLRIGQHPELDNRFFRFICHEGNESTTGLQGYKLFINSQAVMWCANRLVVGRAKVTLAEYGRRDELICLTNALSCHQVEGLYWLERTDLSTSLCRTAMQQKRKGIQWFFSRKAHLHIAIRWRPSTQSLPNAMIHYSCAVTQYAKGHHRSIVWMQPTKFVFY